eukprot:1138171-Pelagomonas_calceolata.AAC.6
MQEACGSNENPQRFINKASLQGLPVLLGLKEVHFTMYDYINHQIHCAGSLLFFILAFNAFRIAFEGFANHTAQQVSSPNNTRLVNKDAMQLCFYFTHY